MAESSDQTPPPIDLQGYEPQEGDAWRARPVPKPKPKPQGGFGLAPAPGEDNDAYARQYSTD